MKYGKDVRFKDIPKMKERETLFADHVAELRKLEREASQKKKDIVDETVMLSLCCGGSPPNVNI